MSHTLRLLCILLVAATVLPLVAQPYLDTKAMTTYDTGIRTLNGQWRVGSHAHVVYYDRWAEEAIVDWRAIHWINSTTGALLVSSGWQQFRGTRFYSNVEGIAQFATCYQGKTTVTAGGLSREIGATHICTNPPPPTPDWCDTHPTAEECGFDSTCPIVINTGAGPWRLSGLGDMVRFDLDADSVAEELTWTGYGTALAFLAYDRNGNGTIDDGRELFGNATPAPSGMAFGHGFLALLSLDANGDQTLNSTDQAWASLLLWTDANHDAVSQSSELVRVSDSGLLSLDLRYHWSAREDQHGNALRYEAVARFARGARPYYDVFFVRSNP